jgi:hypothetical protein
LIILSGQYRESKKNVLVVWLDLYLFFSFLVSQIQSKLISLTLTRLFCFVNEQENKHLILRISVQEFFSEKLQDTLTKRGKYSLQPW